MTAVVYRIGRAGWALSKAHRAEFPEHGTHLERYATRFSAVEINSSFYRPHRPATYARWAASVPADFSFAVKVPKAITHQARLVETERLLDGFVAEVTSLGPKLGCLLVQLPPSLAYDCVVADRFFDAVRARFDGVVALEPRHPSWFATSVTVQLTAFRVARVAADPAPVPAAAEPGGWNGVVYFRLHGSPRIYYSAYEDAFLDEIAARMREAAERARAVWCIFDNTALDAATPNALGLLERAASPSARRLTPIRDPGPTVRSARSDTGAKAAGRGRAPGRGRRRRPS